MISSVNTSLCRRARDLAIALAGHASLSIVVACAFVALAFVSFEALCGPLDVDISLLSTAWYPASGQFGLSRMLLGSVILTVGTSLVAAPLGISAAMCCAVLAPRRVSQVLRQILFVAAALPSVVYGFWGLEHIVPRIAAIQGPGTSLLAGILTLSLMTMPSIALFGYGVLSSFPRIEATAASALGLSAWTTVTQIVIPPRKAGLLMATLLGVERALGETMAVLMVTGNVPSQILSPFLPIRTLAANIGLEMGYAEGAHRSALFFGAFLLGVAVLALVLVQTRLDRRVHG
jgi:phosphate transport system permease protein